MAAIPTDSLVYYSSGQIKKISSSDDIVISGAFTAGSLSAGSGSLTAGSGTFSGSVNITGNLVVTGDIVSADSYSVNIGDSFINLLAANITGGPFPGGFTVNIEAQTAAITASAFAANSGGTDGVITVGTNPVGVIDALDIIQVSGSKNGTNDGLYVVQSVSTTTITVKSNPGANAPDTASVPFVKAGLSASTGESAKVAVAKVSAFAVSGGSIPKAGGGNVAAGTWCYHTGTTQTAFAAGWTSIDTVTVSLQNAYDGGNTITLTNGNDLIVNKPTGLGTAAISLEANLASDITIDGAPLTLSASRIDLNTGNVNFAKAGGLLADTTAVSAGQVVFFDSSGNAQASDANSGTLANREVVGVATASGASAFVATVSGTRVFVEFGGGTPTAGNVAYLSETAGQATTTPPSSAARVTRLGTVTATAASGTLYEIIWNPQYIIDLP